MISIFNRKVLIGMFLSIGFVSEASAAINLQRLRNVSELGWYNETNFNMEETSGNTNSDGYSGRLRFDYLTENYDSFIVFGGEIASAEDVVIKENVYTHLRGSRKVSDLTSFEVFSQYERDNIVYLDARYQIGAGLSWKIMDTVYGKTDDYEGRKFTMKYGSNLLSQVEEYDNQKIANDNGTPFEDKNNNSNRFANYLSLSYKLSDNTFLSGTSTFDFNIEEIEDFTLKTSVDLGVRVVKNVSLVFGLEHNYDNDPVAGFKNADLKIKNGISVFF